MKISMLSIGDELLDGRIQDSNSQIVGRFLSNSGNRLEQIHVVPDDISKIVNALDACSSGIVIVSGGLGPTVDDLTRFAIAQWSGQNLQEDEDSLNIIRSGFEARGYPFTDNNRRQALFPKGAEILPNARGSAPGFCVRKGAKTVFSFPGVPREFEWFFNTYLVKEVQDKLSKKYLRAIFLQGIGESTLADRLSDLEKFNVDIAYRAFFPTVELKLNAVDKNELLRAFEYVFEHVSRFYICEGNDTLAKRVGRLLKEKNATLSTAESCTAGGIGAAITDVPGSSAWFEMGFITYSNHAKKELLGVDSSVLDVYGAVSLQTVAQMALGARKKSGAAFGVSVSGIAGPGGGSKEKPVGTVWFGLSTEKGTYCLLAKFIGFDRERIRAASVATALRFVLWALEDRLHEHPRIQGPYTDIQVIGDEGISLLEASK